MIKFLVIIISSIGILYYWILPGDQIIECALLGMVLGIGIKMK